MQPDTNELTTAQVAALGLGGLCALGLVLWLPPACAGRLSPSGYAWFGAALTLTVGLLGIPSRHRWPRAAAVIGTLALITLAVARSATPAPGAPSPGFHGVTPSLVDEQDLNVIAATWLPVTGVFTTRERRGFAAALAALGRTLRLEEGHGTGRPDGDELRYVVESPEGTVVFLHGYGGSVASFCWVVASAAAASGWDTICPSCGFSGEWWREPCRADVASLVRETHSTTDRPVILAGLSNGGTGASRIAPHLEHLDGLVLLSGADTRVPLPDVPTLVIHGRSDSAFPATSAEAHCLAAPQCEYTALDGGHFVLAKRYHDVRAAIRAWLDVQR